MQGAARVTFADVAGIDEAKAELVEIVDFLKNPEGGHTILGLVPGGRTAEELVYGGRSTGGGERHPAAQMAEQSMSRPDTGAPI